MPQMAPSMWLITMISVTLMMLATNSITFFHKNKTLMKKKIMISQKNWKW